MREILFRGKRLDNGKWVEGFFVKRIDRLTLIPKCYILVQEEDTSGITGEPTGYLNTEFSWYEVIPETVGQYTGLKDNNGKRIFEGDILRIAKISDGLGSYYHPPLDYPVNVVVKWDLCAWMWETLCEDKRYISFPNAWCHYECEIIGNIHDNPELLEVDNG